jgi:hypothetical protein
VAHSATVSISFGEWVRLRANGGGLGKFGWVGGGLGKFTACIVSVFWPPTGSGFYWMRRWQPLKLQSVSILSVQIDSLVLGICAWKLPTPKEEIETQNFHHFLAPVFKSKVSNKPPKGGSIIELEIVKVNH